MKVAQYSVNGEPSEVVNLTEIDSEPIGANQVKISLEASPINPADLLAIRGLYPIRPKLPAIPGNEGIGRVTEIGNQVSNLKLGDRVFLPFRAGIGAWREALVTPSKDLFSIPKDVDPLQLSMASVNPPTAYYMLTKYIKLNKGDWIIQNAANSAVGNYVITFAKSMGLKTVNVVRREDVIDDLQNLGGDIVLVDSKDLKKRVQVAVQKEPIKLGFDGVAGDATHRLSQCLAFGSTLVNYGAMSLKRCELGATQTIFNQTKLVGVWLQRWTQLAPIEEVKALYEKTNNAVIQGTVKASIDRVYSLDQIKEALKHADQQKRRGKIILTGPKFHI